LQQGITTDHFRNPWIRPDISPGFDLGARNPNDMTAGFSRPSGSAFHDSYVTPGHDHMAGLREQLTQLVSFLVHALTRQWL
jgi:hypothetical protein